MADSLAELASLLYEAAVQPHMWHNAVNRLAHSLNADSVAIFGHPAPPATGAVFSDNLREMAHWFISEGGHLINPRPERGLRAAGAIITEANLFSAWELENLPFNREMINRFGFRYEAGSAFTRIGDVSLLFTTQRTRRRGPYLPQDVANIGALIPHLRRASEIGVRLAEARAAGRLEAYETLGCGCVLIDFAGRVRGMNKAAERLLGRGIAIVCGRLTATHRGGDAGLQALITGILSRRDLASAHPPPFAVLPRAEARPLIAHGIPILRAAEDLFQHVQALLLITDPEDVKEPDEAILRQAFKLTAAEARLAAALARGEDIAGAAYRYGLSIETVRTQLKSILGKTDTHRQAELVALLNRVILPLRR